MLLCVAISGWCGVKEMVLMMEDGFLEYKSKQASLLIHFQVVFVKMLRNDNIIEILLFIVKNTISNILGVGTGRRQRSEWCFAVFIRAERHGARGGGLKRRSEGPIL